MANPRMTAEIGRVLGGRYRLVAPIGMGASAQVYLADDVKLRRRVALKMLHDALADDAEFLRRFRAEAQAAAALSHPNVMAVYDWSDGRDEGEVAFIVTEYLPGGSLRALLDHGAQLTPAQALAVGVEAARALDYAHRRGFVHRDIKPANLLFGEDQRLRIADFGLARALAEAAWTEPQGAVLGTARYASPEQAKGESLTGEADVYALALVLVETVTGEVPFVADTTLGTLMARVDRDLEVPDALGPLAPVLAQAGRADPEARIDARTLAKGLLRAARQLSRPAPLPLAGALAAGATLVADADPTLLVPAEGEPANDLTADDLDLDPPPWVNQADPGAPAAAGVATVAAVARDGAGPVVADPLEVAVEPVAEPADEVVDLTEGPEARPGEDDGGAGPDDGAGPPGGDGPGHDEGGGDDGTDQVPVVAASGDDDGGEGDGGDDEHHRRWPWVALLILVVAGAATAAALVATRQDPVAAGPAIVLPVPDLVGQDEAAATAVAEAGGWKVTVVRERRDGTTKGEVIASSPDPGARYDEGRTITLTVSAGQTIVDVPGDLGGKTLDDATKALADVGLKAAQGDTAFDEDVPKGSVIGVVDGTPSKLEKGSTVPLVVSDGPEPRVVPSGLVGSTEQAAKDALSSIGLQAAIVRSYSDSVAEGLVISVLPASGTTVDRGTSVNVEVSRGPELVAVPDVSGASSINEAVAILKAKGLVAGDVSGPASGTPQGTKPGAGTMVRPGSSVDIILG